MNGRMIAIGSLSLITISAVMLTSGSVLIAQQPQTDTFLHKKPPVPKQQTWTEESTGIEFVWVDGGCYQMGCASNTQYSQGSLLTAPQRFADIAYWQWPLAMLSAFLPVGCASPSYYHQTGCFSEEQPAHEVCVDGFYMGKYEVSQREYETIVSRNNSRFKGDNHPTEKISWLGTQIFIHKLNEKSGKNFRLPTEAEWEYAARSGGKDEMYAGSNSIDSVAWYSANSGDSTQQVGTKSPNGLGLYDMSGNVWEWCSDYYGKEYYTTSPKNNPQGPIEGPNRVARGGSWSLDTPYSRTAFRFWYNPASHYGAIGFRLVLPGL